MVMKNIGAKSVTAKLKMMIELRNNMPKVNWLLEEKMFEENIEGLQHAIIKQGMEFKNIKYIPFKETDFKNYYDPSDCVVFYGSLNLGREIQRNTDWIPGSFCNLKNFECVHYYPQLSKFLLNNRYIMLPFGDLLQQKDFLFDTLGNNDCLFIRPSTGFKSFAGTIISKQNYEQEISNFGFGVIESDKIVVVSEPQNLIEEWRLVAADKVIVTGSQYKNSGIVGNNPHVPDEVIEFGNQVAAVWQPDRAFTVDVCRTRSGDFRLIEINSFSSSGLYACDMDKIVKAVSMSAIKEWIDYNDEIRANESDGF